MEQGMWLMQIVMLVLMAYLIIKMLKMSKRNGLNRKMLAVLDCFADEEEFFSQADLFIENEKNQEFVNKTRVLRIWGDVRYERDEDLKKDLELLDLDALLMREDKKEDHLSLNEDSFFYLYIAIPNRLYYRGRMDLLEVVDQKLNTIQEDMKDMLVYNMKVQAMKYYEHRDDEGKKFFNDLLAGDYGDYKYTKQLIGIYKNVGNALLARIALDHEDAVAYSECIGMLESFETSPLGQRFLQELDIKVIHSDDQLMSEETSDVIEAEIVGEDIAEVEAEIKNETEEDTKE